MLKPWTCERDAYTVGAPSRLLGDVLPIETAWFKTVFEAKRGFKTEISVFAVSRYCLYVNGVMVHNGPQKGDKNTSYVDRIDLAPWLTDGTNVLSVKVTSYPPAEAYVHGHGFANWGPFGITGTASGPCLLVQGGGEDIDLSTGYAPWYVWNDASVQYSENYEAVIMGGMERITVSKMSYHTMDDNLEGFVPVEKRWTQCCGVTTSVPPFALYERTIPQMRLDAPKGFERIMSRTEDGCTPFALLNERVTLAPHGHYAVDLDAGALQTAYVMLSMNGGSGAEIRLQYAEAYSNICNDGAYPNPIKGKRDDCEHYGFHGLTDAVLPDGRAWTYSPFWFRTFRFVRLVVTTADEALTLEPIVYRTTRYPLEVKAKISPQQDWVRYLWDISVRTLELCMHETHEDCPFYEQLQYILDTRLQMLFTYALSADTRMAERVIHDFHSSLLPEGILQSRYPSMETQVIPCFALHWIGMLYDYTLQTGSTTLIHRYRTTVESVLDWFGRKRTERGLAEKLGYWEFFDWPNEWGPGYGSPNAVLKEGVSTAENLAYAYFLGIGAKLLEMIGHTQDAEFYREDRRGVLEAVREYCWDEEKGLYREGPSTQEYSQHAQFYAVLNELVTGEDAVNLMQKVLDDKTLIQATFPLRYPLFRALEKVGLYEQTEKLWPLWRTLLTENLSTVPEVPGPQTRSDCHAWGAQLLFEYPRCILGVYPEEPGYDVIGIHPQGLFFGQAEGEVPTPKGTVSVSWKNADGKFEMEAHWCKGVPARITLPNGTVVTLTDGYYKN